MLSQSFCVFVSFIIDALKRTQNDFNALFWFQQWLFRRLFVYYYDMKLIVFNNVVFKVMKTKWRYIILLVIFVLISLVTFVKWTTKDINKVNHIKQSHHRHSYLDDSFVHYSISTHNKRSSSVHYYNKINIEKCSIYDLNCFNLHLCDPTTGPIKVHINPFPPEVQVSTTFFNLLQVIHDSPHYTSSPEEACVFISGNHDTLDRDPLSPNFSHKLNPLPNDGLNYLIFNLFSGSWPNYSELDFGHWTPGRAMIAKASFSSLNYRSSFDISLPLFPHSHPVKGVTFNGFDNLNPPKHSSNRHLLVFKGKRYTYGIGSETRNALHHLHSPPEIIILTTCKHGKKWQELRDERCDHDNQDYDSYDYLSLMINSSFCLVPRGRRLASFRFLESLEVSCIPVLLSNEWVLPFEDVIDWSLATLRADERLLFQIPEMLRNLNENKLAKMRSQGQALYETYFSSIERIAMTAIAIIEERVFRERSRQSFIWNRVVTPGSLTGAWLFNNKFSDDLNRFPGFDGFMNKSMGYTAVIRINQLITSQMIVKLLRQTLLKSLYFRHLILQVQNDHLSFSSHLLSHPMISLVTSSINCPLKTDAVFFLDPMTCLSSEELDFAYLLWLSFPHRLIGFVSRSHFHVHNTQWQYSSKWTNQFSSISMEATIFHNYYLFLYEFFNHKYDDCFHLSFVFMISHWTREPPIKASQRHNTLSTETSMTQSFMNSQKCFNQLVQFYGYLPLINSQVRFDPVLFKDDVSMVRKKYKKMETNQR